MKDAYSFDIDAAGLERSYRAMYDAYCRIFDRIGVAYRVVEADPGAIGGDGGTHEFMVVSDAGEDTVVSCRSCEYAANVEKAAAHPLPAAESPIAQSPETVPTPHVRTIVDLAALLHVDAGQIIKVIIYQADGNPVAACLRGDHEVNEIKLKNLLGVRDLRLASSDEVLALTGKPVGFVGPDVDMPVVFDRDILSISDGVVASGEADCHDIHVVPGRDFAVQATEDIRMVTAGDACLKCGGALEFVNGIEVAHIFKLGTKYSSVFRARFVDAAGSEQTMLMGCYGLGTSRVIPAVIEQCHDADGIVWPVAIAPYQVHIVPVSVRDEQQMQVAEAIHQRLYAAGVEVLLDDRDERPGVKFKDADLLGLPVRLTVGNKISEGLVELKIRQTGEVQVLSVEQAFAAVLGMVK